MKKLFVLWSVLVAVVLSSGCGAKDGNVIAVESTPVQTEIQKGDEMKSQAIVIFKEGVSYDEAEKILEGYSIVVVKQYKTLSEQNNQLYLEVKSSKTTEEMVETLQKDSAVHSVSANRKSKLMD